MRHRILSSALFPFPSSRWRQSSRSNSIRSVFKWGERFFHRPQSPVRSFPESGFVEIDAARKIEEETVPTYEADRFYPVRIGEVFNSRYQVLGKLGYGATSTVWLCRDLQGHHYRALKVYMRTSNEIRELVIHKHLSNIGTNHAGKQDIRSVLDAFEVSSPDGHRHTCLIHEPLGTSLRELMEVLPGRSLPEELLKIALRHVLIALDFLHTEAHVIHTDLQPRNILNRIQNETILADFEKAEFEHPCARKVLGNRIIYQSRALPLTTGMPVLCDFGEAVFGEVEHEHDIMPDAYRAPEVILDMKWNYQVDVWNVGVMIWTLFEPRNLFDGRNPEGKLSNKHHLAEMISILGPPPLAFLRRSKKYLEYWDEAGNWRGLVDIPDNSFGKAETRLDGKNKDMFLQFMKKMLQWEPEKRATVKELIFDSWLRGNLY